MAEKKSWGDVRPDIQWFPGHMAKTRRLIQSNLKLVDVVLEIADARIPASSRNPELSGWLRNKPRVLMLNKSDSADPDATKQWLSYYRSKGVPVIDCDCKSGANVKKIIPLIKDTLSELLLRRKKKGMSGRAIRVMVVGVPNVGKSSFINRMAGRRSAKVENRPGVTVGTQWVTLEQGLELLDMPGVLWPKFSDLAVGEKLAFTGAIKDQIVDLEALSSRFLTILAKSYPDRLTMRYGLDSLDDYSGYELLRLVGKKRGMLVSGGEVDTERAAGAVLDDYRSGKLGRLTLELPKTVQKKAKSNDAV